jgi:hypothetical protein
VVHLRSRISDDANVLGEEVVAMLWERSVWIDPLAPEERTRPKSAGNYSEVSHGASSFSLLEYLQSSSLPNHQRRPRLR